RCFDAISARCLWRSAGHDARSRSCGNQNGGPRLEDDGAANEIPGITLATTGRRNLGGAWRTQKFHALKSDGLVSVRLRGETGRGMRVRSGRASWALAKGSGPDSRGGL